MWTPSWIVLFVLKLSSFNILILIVLCIISSEVVTSLGLNLVIFFFSSTLYPLIFHIHISISQAILTYSVLLTPNPMIFCWFSYNFLSLSFAIQTAEPPFSLQYQSTKFQFNQQSVRHHSIPHIKNKIYHAQVHKKNMSIRQKDERKLVNNVVILEA